LKLKSFQKVRFGSKIMAATSSSSPRPTRDQRAFHFLQLKFRDLLEDIERELEKDDRVSKSLELRVGKSLTKSGIDDVDIAYYLSDAKFRRNNLFWIRLSIEGYQDRYHSSPKEVTERRAEYYWSKGVVKCLRLRDFDSPMMLNLRNEDRAVIKRLFDWMGLPDSEWDPYRNGFDSLTDAFYETRYTRNCQGRTPFNQLKGALSHDEPDDVVADSRNKLGDLTESQQEILFDSILKSGNLERAKQWYETMPCEPNPSVTMGLAIRSQNLELIQWLDGTIKDVGEEPLDFTEQLNNVTFIDDKTLQIIQWIDAKCEPGKLDYNSFLLAFICGSRGTRAQLQTLKWTIRRMRAVKLPIKYQALWEAVISSSNLTKVYYEDQIEPRLAWLTKRMREDDIIPNYERLLEGIFEGRIKCCDLESAFEVIESQTQNINYHQLAMVALESSFWDGFKFLATKRVAKLQVEANYPAYFTVHKMWTHHDTTFLILDLVRDCPEVDYGDILKTKFFGFGPRRLELIKYLAGECRERDQTLPHRDYDV
jgi:hypothetical protein